MDGNIGVGAPRFKHGQAQEVASVGQPAIAVASFLPPFLLLLLGSEQFVLQPILGWLSVSGNAFVAQLTTAMVVSLMVPWDAVFLKGFSINTRIVT